jgi:hypothetical protein
MPSLQTLEVSGRADRFNGVEEPRQNRGCAGPCDACGRTGVFHTPPARRGAYRSMQRTGRVFRSISTDKSARSARYLLRTIHRRVTTAILARRMHRIQRTESPNVYRPAAADIAML